VALVAPVGAASPDGGQDKAGAGSGTWLDSLVERDTLTDRWFSLGRPLEDNGITVSLGVTQTYQINTQGGLATDRQKGRLAGSYDLEIEADLDKLISLPGGSVYVLVEGSWSGGTDPISVGSLSGVNGDAAGNRKIDVSELWFEQALLDDSVLVRAGKLDMTGGFESKGCPWAFDGNSFANDETSQFLNGFLVNNPTIPFPDNGLGLMAHVQATKWLCMAAGIAFQAGTWFTVWSMNILYTFVPINLSAKRLWSVAEEPLGGSITAAPTHASIALWPVRIV